MFEVREGTLGSLPTVEISNSQTGVSASIALRGATLLAWNAGIGDGAVGGNLDGYIDEAEFLSQNGVRNGVMAPFSNRIKLGRYTFGGADYDVMPGVAEEDRLIYHGYLREIDCTLVRAEVTDTEATVVLGTSAIRAGVYPGYPFDIDLEVSYRFAGSGLTVEINGHNVGDTVAPYCSGWHPYFRLGQLGIDRLKLHVPARTAIRTDDDLIPNEGNAAYQPIADDERPTYETPSPLADDVIDACYANLIPDADGVIRTSVKDPLTGCTLTVWQTEGLMHLFTGDTVAREPRTSIALEPVEVMTDAFNRPDTAQAVALAPGATRRFVFGVELAAG